MSLLSLEGDGDAAAQTLGNVARSLPPSRNTCKLKDIVGSVAIVYALPSAIEFS